MVSFDIKEAAAFLKISVRTLQREIKKGNFTPRRASERKKFFLECDLVGNQRQDDNQSRGLSVIDGGLSTQENKQWQSTNKKKAIIGISTSSMQAAKELDNLLERKTNRGRKNSMTNSKQNRGG